MCWAEAKYANDVDIPAMASPRGVCETLHAALVNGQLVSPCFWDETDPLLCLSRMNKVNQIWICSFHRRTCTLARWTATYPYVHSPHSLPCVLSQVVFSTHVFNDETTLHIMILSFCEIGLNTVDHWCRPSSSLWPVFMLYLLAMTMKCHHLAASHVSQIATFLSDTYRLSQTGLLGSSSYVQ